MSQLQVGGAVSLEDLQGAQLLLLLSKGSERGKETVGIEPFSRDEQTVSEQVAGENASISGYMRTTTSGDETDYLSDFRKPLHQETRTETLLSCNLRPQVVFQ